MISLRTRARIIGVLFIGAAVFSILGTVLEFPILNNPDYVLEGPTNANQVVLGAYLELIAVGTMVGTGIAFFPLFKRYGDSLALGYAAFRFLEATLVTIGATCILTILAIRQEVVTGTALEAATLETAGEVLRSVHELTFILGPNFMLGINTSIAAYVLYRTRLVPRPIAMLGLAGAGLISIAAILELFGIIAQASVYGATLALPIFAYEMSLAVWLIVWGFNSSSSILRSETVSSSSSPLGQD